MKTFIKIFTLIYLFHFRSNLFSQTGSDIEWQRTIGGNYNDILRESVQTPDGGYILGGDSYSEVTGDKTIPKIGNSDFWILKINSAGEVQWQKIYGSTEIESLSSLKLTADGGYLLGGTSNAYLPSGDKTEHGRGDPDFWIVKIDSVGNLMWEKTYGGYSTDVLIDAFQTSDGGYVMGGYTTSSVTVLHPDGDMTGTSLAVDFWVIKIDSARNILWQRVLGGSEDDYMWDFALTSDGGTLACGHTKSGVSGTKTTAGDGLEDYWVVKLDSNGNEEWENNIGGGQTDVAYSVREATDHNFFVAGYSDSNISGEKTENRRGVTDFWILKLNDEGEILWDKTIGGNSYDQQTCLENTNDGGLIVGGYSQSKLTGDKTDNKVGLDDYWVIKLDAYANIEWQNTVGGKSEDFLISIVPSTDNGYLLSGYSESNIGGDKAEAKKGFYDYWAVKIYSCDSAITFYADADGDGFGDPLADTIIITCVDSIPPTFIKTPGDCNDLDSLVNPSATDVCNGIDDNCSGSIDEYSITAIITPSGSLTFCTGETVILNATADTSYLYQWKKNGADIAGATASSFTANTTGQYQVFISNGICSDVSDSISAVRNAKPNPVINNPDAINDLCFDASIKLKTASGPGNSYQWYKGATALAGATSNVYMATVMGNYKVRVTNSFGCAKTSAAYSIIKTCRFSGEESSTEVSLYPNPNNGDFVIHLPEIIPSAIISVSIKNIMGQQIYYNTIELRGSECEITSGKNLANGLYFVEVKINNNIYSQQFIISR